MRPFLYATALALGCAVSGTAFAQAPALVREGVIASVSDGDTATVCGTGLSPFQDCIGIRVYGLNTPEKRLCKPGDRQMKSCEPCRKGAALGLAASTEAKKLYPSGTKAEVRAYGPDNNGRIVADIVVNGVSWSEEMIRKGLGEPYLCPHGKCGARPRPWCEN